MGDKTKQRVAIFNPKAADMVLSRMLSGESLRAACKVAGIEPASFLRWTYADPDLAQQYASVKRDMAELVAAEIIDIADEAPPITPLGTVDSGAIAHQRLRVDTRKWILSKVLPKVYGDKLAIGGADDMPAIKQDVTIDAAEAYKRLLGAPGGG